MIAPLFTIAVLSFFVMLWEILGCSDDPFSEKEKDKTWLYTAGAILAFSLVTLSTQL